MKKEDFFNWLAGYIDLVKPHEPNADGSPRGLTMREANIIKDHIDLVRKTEAAAKEITLRTYC